MKGPERVLEITETEPGGQEKLIIHLRTGNIEVPHIEIGTRESIPVRLGVERRKIRILKYTTQSTVARVFEGNEFLLENSDLVTVAIRQRGYRRSKDYLLVVPADAPYIDKPPLTL